MAQIFSGNHYICRRIRERVVIGSQARLRIWCLRAYGFESLRSHKKSKHPFRGRDACFCFIFCLASLVCVHYADGDTVLGRDLERIDFGTVELDLDILLGDAGLDERGLDNLSPLL